MSIDIEVIDAFESARRIASKLGVDVVCDEGEIKFMQGETCLITTSSAKHAHHAACAMAAIEERLSRRKESSSDNMLHLARVYDICVDNEARSMIRALLKNDVFEGQRQGGSAKVGDKVSGAGYCHDAPGGVVYHMDENDRAHCVTITGKDGSLARDGYAVFGHVDFVPGMLRAYRNIVIEEMAKFVVGLGESEEERERLSEISEEIKKLKQKTEKDAN